VWQILPIWLISSSEEPPILTKLPTGSERRSIPDVVMFSAKSPGPTLSPSATILSIDS